MKRRHPMKSVLVSGDEAIIAAGQHKRPCRDCPFGRKALPGWLGGDSIEQWLQWVHGEAIIECHTASGAQCAGAAIFRANVVKTCRTDEALRLPPDKEIVFASSDEFRAHHNNDEGIAERTRKAMAPTPEETEET